MCWSSFVPVHKSQLLNVQEFCKLVYVTSLKLAIVIVFMKIGKYYKSELFSSEHPVVKYLPANHCTLRILIHSFPAPDSRDDQGYSVVNV